MFNGANDHPRHATEVPTYPVETWSPPKREPYYNTLASLLGEPFCDRMRTFPHTSRKTAQDRLRSRTAFPQQSHRDGARALPTCLRDLPEFGEPGSYLAGSKVATQHLVR